MKKVSIYDAFPIRQDEYARLEKEFGQLCHYAAWQLLKRNAKNNHTDDFEDIDQDLRAALVQAGSYYKRQVYIERCFSALGVVMEVDENGDPDFRVEGDYVTNPLCKAVLIELALLWKNRTRHGANRQKFGPYQEAILWRIVKKCVPRGKRPSKRDALVIDEKFPTYCKQIIWNKQKAMGKRITREKSLRSGLTSLSEFDHLAKE